MTTAQNKANLALARQHLQTYNRYLPALELKQQKLVLERCNTEKRIVQLERQIVEFNLLVEEQLPMLGAEGIALDHLVQVEQITWGCENLAGLVLPTLAKLSLRRQPYGFLTRPHWVEALADHWEAYLCIQLDLHLQRNRFALIEIALRKVTQRVNLFGKVLIPAAKQEIHRIGIFLSDQERGAVVRSKIAKQRMQEYQA